MLSWVNRWKHVFLQQGAIWDERVWTFHALSYDANSVGHWLISEEGQL